MRPIFAYLGQLRLFLLVTQEFPMGTGCLYAMGNALYGLCYHVPCKGRELWLAATLTRAIMHESRT
jgi:hypothetical protein